MPYHPFHILHLISVFLLIGITFMAFAAPNPEMRKPILMWSGICSLLVFLTGFGLLGVLKTGFPIWVWVKLFAWLIVSAAAGIAFRKRDQLKGLLTFTMLAVALAVVMVSLKPF